MTSSAPTEHEPAVVERELRYHGLAFDGGNQLRWPENDRGHPRHWPVRTKIFNTVVIFSLDFCTTMFSTSGSGASLKGRDEFHIGSTYSIFCFTSIYLFSQAIGGLICPPISESFGRKTLYVSSMFLYSIFCILVGFAPNIGAVIAGRALSGLVSSIAGIVVGGSIEDMFDSEARIWMVFAWGSTANIAIATGPIYSTYVTELFGWRWVFWIAAIVTFSQACFCLLLRESRPSVILKKRLAKLNEKPISSKPFTIDDPDEVLSLHNFVIVSLVRPTRLFYTEPIVFFVTMLAAFASGQIYLFTEALPAIYTQPPLNWSEEKASLTFIPIAIGLALNVIPRFYDHFHLKKVRAQGKIVKPEDKIRMFAFAAPILAIGLWWFAWSIPPRVSAPWIVSLIPLIFVGYATSEFDCTLTGYMADSYTIFCASAFASLAFLRSIVSGILPLVTKQMYHKLGANYATTALAAAATLFCAVPVLFLKYGERLRERSEFAKFSREAESKMGSTRPNSIAEAAEDGGSMTRTLWQEMG